MASGTGNLPNQNMVFTPLDILTAEELNEVVANIESLADGSGIGDELLSSNPSLISSGATGVGLYEIGRTTLGGAGDSISVTVAAKKYLRVYISAIPTGGTINGSLQFNSDTGNNYALRRIVDHSGGTATSQSSLQISPNTASAAFNSEVLITNNASEEKLSSWQSTGRGTLGAGNLPSSVYGSGKWANTSTQITTITLTNGGTGDFAVGSQVLVVGSD